MATAKPGPTTGDTAPLVIVVGFAVAAVLSWLRYPGLLVIPAAMVVAPWFSSPPTFTGPKDSSGQPTAAGREHVKMRRWQRWRLLARTTVFPNGAWLPGSWSRESDHPIVQVVRQMLPRFSAVITVVRIVLAFVPTRTASLAGLGLGIAAATLPVDSLPVHLWWANAAAVYVATVALDHAVRFTADDTDPAPEVGVHLVVADFSRPDTRGHAIKTQVAAVIVGLTVGVGVLAALRYAHLAWLIWPAGLTGTGLGIAAAAAVVHGAYRAQAHEMWLGTISARAEWKPRWESLKQAVRLVTHEDLPGGGTLDVFDAPATLGSPGALAMTAKVAPFVGSGMTFSLLPAQNVDAGGNPLPGSTHPIRFRAVVLPAGSTPNPADPDADTRVLGLWAEVLAANAARSVGGQVATVPMLDRVHRVSADDSDGVCWEARWVSPDGTATAAEGIRSGMESDAVTDGETTWFGVLDFDRTTFADPALRASLEALAESLRWKRRWRDIMRTEERGIPWLQWEARQEAVLAVEPPVTIHSRPHKTSQGDGHELYMTAAVSKKLPTTLGNAPFVTVTGFPDGAEPGSRYQGAFTVLWADKPIPSDPSRIPVSGKRLAARWALARSINDAFDAAKLPRPEVAEVEPMTTARSADAIWRISLRLYDGATLSAVKRAATKLQASMQTPWLCVSGGEYGCDIYAGVSPTTQGLRFTSPRHRTACMALDWEQAFTDANLDSLVDGTAPKLLESAPVESNKQVTRYQFTLPRGRALSDFQEERMIAKLRGATGNAFLSVRPAKDPAEFVLLASQSDPMPTPAPFMWDLIADDTRKIPFGTRVEGTPAVWSLETDSHLLVLGQNGSGKGVTMTAIAAPMLINGWDVFAGDPIKGFNDFVFADPWLTARTTTYEQTAAMLKHVIGLVEARKLLNAAHGVANVRDLPPEAQPPMTAVFLDEFTSLVIPDVIRKPPEGADQFTLSEFATASRINECKQIIGAAVGRLVREGRATGVVLVLAGQKLTSDVMNRIPGGSTIKSQLSRLAMGKMGFGDMASAFSDPTAAMGLLGDSVPRGRGVFESTAEAPIAVQAWWGGGDQAEHFRSIFEHIAASRQPIADEDRIDFSGADDAAAAETAPAFGQRIDTAASASALRTPLPIMPAPDEEIAVVIDAGSLELSFDDEDEPDSTETVVADADAGSLGLSFDDDDDNTAASFDGVPDFDPSNVPVPAPASEAAAHPHVNTSTPVDEFQPQFPAPVDAAPEFQPVIAPATPLVPGAALFAGPGMPVDAAEQVGFEVIRIGAASAVQEVTRVLSSRPDLTRVAVAHASLTEDDLPGVSASAVLADLLSTRSIAFLPVVESITPDALARFADAAPAPAPAEPRPPDSDGDMPRTPLVTPAVLDLFPEPPAPAPGGTPVRFD